MRHAELGVGLALAVLWGVPGSAEDAVAPEPRSRLEFVFSVGGGTSFGTPSMEDGWSVRVPEFFGELNVSTTARYEPRKPFGASGSAQMWLPFGMGVFVEVQKEGQDLGSRLAAELSARFRACATCPLETFTANGKLDSERFERNETRLHLGLGYRLRVWRDAYVEVSGGTTRVSLRQELARQVEGDLDDCPPFSRQCSFPLRLEQRESRKGSTWGFNAGTGFTKFINKNVGAAAHLRYSKGGDLDLTGLEAFDATGNQYRTTVKVGTGGFTTGGSLRLRF